MEISHRLQSLHESIPEISLRPPPLSFKNVKKSVEKSIAAGSSNLIRVLEVSFLEQGKLDSFFTCGKLWP